MSNFEVSALSQVLAALDFTESDAAGEIRIIGSDPVAPSVHRLGDASAAALAALGAELAVFWRQRGGAPQHIEVRVEEAIRQLSAPFFTTVNGVSVLELAEDPKLFSNTAFYRARENRFIHLVLSYPHLRDVVCSALDCAPTHSAIAQAVSERDAFELEEEISRLGGAAAVVRSQREWQDHPQGRYLLDTPLVTVQKVADAPRPGPRQSGQQPSAPLSGVRVLDNTHVIAGPIASRIMAEHGAEVLHLSKPSRPDPNAMIIDTGLGKRSAFCDLTDPADVEKFWATLADADLFVNSYLGLEGKGFGVEQLIARRPGLIVLNVRSWGIAGDWAQRRGFDQPVCAATGIATEEGSSQAPQLPPTHLLNDYLAALLGAAGAVEALRRRERDGGSYTVQVDLARMSMWVQSLGLFEPELVQDLPRPSLTGPVPGLQKIAGSWGSVSYLPSQIRYSNYRPEFSTAGEPLGASELAWAAEPQE
ncbi:CoA transferase [Psychromicrobium lacuslunae]|uniref:CoA transferase n=1 Tax=Psychromicrobium lacuslunae TaxID=1618207 RepID=UPI000697C873|nr:CoA transferase [Psychromicrobium lacuslunae]